MYIGAPVCGYVHVGGGACGGQKTMSDPLEPKLQELGNHMTLVQGNRVLSFVRAVHLLNHKTISSAHRGVLMVEKTVCFCKNISLARNTSA